MILPTLGSAAAATVRMGLCLRLCKHQGAWLCWRWQYRRFERSTAHLERKCRKENRLRTSGHLLPGIHSDFSTRDQDSGRGLAGADGRWILVPERLESSTCSAHWLSWRLGCNGNLRHDLLNERTRTWRRHRRMEHQGGGRSARLSRHLGQPRQGRRFAGTNLEADKCAREQPLSDNCRASFLNFHLTANSSAYIENVWVWTADHDLDYGNRAQVNIQSGRGILVESAQGPVWMYGSASEHSILYQYNVVNADNIFICLAQTETAYFQGTGREVASAEEPLSLQAYQDPNFNLSSSQSSSSPFQDPSDPYENRGLGMRIANSTNVFVYGAGFYSFFDNYDQSQVSARRSQKMILWLQDLKDDANVWVLNLNTVGVEKMVTVDGENVVDEGPLRNGFGNTLAVWATQLS